MTGRYKKRLLTHISHDRYTPTNVAQIIDDLGIDDPPAFRAELAELAEEGIVSLNQQGFVALPSYGDGQQIIEGEFRGTTRGFGFLRSDIKTREGDLFIPPDNTLGALSGDRVKVGVIARARWQACCGARRGEQVRERGRQGRLRDDGLPRGQ